MDLDAHFRPLFPRIFGCDVGYLPPSGNFYRDALQGSLHNRVGAIQCVTAYVKLTFYLSSFSAFTALSCECYCQQAT